jgi:hypothetical protein
MAEKSAARKNNKALDPRHIFDHACRFLGADQRLRAMGQDAIPLAPAAMVLSAFSAELFLKCLLVLESGAAPPTHRLDILFKGLSHKRRRRIDEIWEGDARPKIASFCRQLAQPSDLSNALIRCGSAFENLRYYYEDPEKVVYYIGDFAWIVMRAIMEIKPEWRPEEPARISIPKG